MRDEGKTKEQLIKELAEMRRRISELEASEAERRRVEEELKRNRIQSDQGSPPTRSRRIGADRISMAGGRNRVATSRKDGWFWVSARIIG